MTANGAFDEISPLRRVALRHPSAAFGDRGRIARQWRGLGYRAAPDFEAAVREFDALVQVIEEAGAAIEWLPEIDDLGLDSLYVRDSLLTAPAGLIAAAMGKPARSPEPAATLAALAARGYAAAGAIAPPARIEGGDLVWLDNRTLLAGRGYRTDEAGIIALRRLLGDEVEVHAFDLPHHRGPGDVFHLMSVLSPVDADLAVVYLPLMPAPLVSFLESRGMGFVEVPDAEFARMGCNVLALAPRRALVVEGHPQTRARLTRAGTEVIEIEGTEICLKGQGGPTCLTRPLLRVR